MSVAAMPRYIAFLRAINVGGRVVKMERLRQIFESLDLGDVETFIASGNVVFTSAVKDAGRLEKKIEQSLQSELGYEVRTFLRSDAELVKITEHEAFEGAGELPEVRLFIGFLSEVPTAAAAARLVEASTDIDQFHLSGRELYWRCRVNSSDSPFSGPKLEKTLGMPTTLRNVNTVRRLVAKYPPE
ncbi:MAG: DUF1697 domain-containing protein [Chthoniobacterales bacterium]|nr:DUF1697 domain-containing protein [Chthoniobacterales bacterium]